MVLFKAERDERTADHVAVRRRKYAGAITDSRSGPAAQWVAQQLATALGDAAPAGPRIDDAKLRSSIHRFQLAQGLPSDGNAGPITLMQLNRATGVDEPHLQRGT